MNEEFLTVAELSDRIKMARQTIYNQIHKKVFELNKHYLKPTPKKVLFKWSAIQAWMEGSDEIGECSATEVSPVQSSASGSVQSSANKPKSLIKI
jgi:hypothetical protein